MPGISLRGTKVSKLLEEIEGGVLDFAGLISGRYGELETEPFGRSTRVIEGDETVTIGLSTGGAGFGDPLERDIASIEQDLKVGLCTLWTAEHIYKVAWDAEHERIDSEKSEAMRTEARLLRVTEGLPFAEFEQAWQTRKPPEEILNIYGTWPDAKPTGPAIRP